MDGTIVLILLVLVMLIGSYVAGSIPLNVNMSEDKLQKVTVFGAGLLVGTALAVIIPEGVRSLFASAAVPPGVDLHTVIGISLVIGFVFMLLVDQLSTRFDDTSHPEEKSVTATLGLVVHAAADGVALGAAASTSHADVEMIVFLAIMLHKAPAAFGLVTFLLHAGLERNRIRKHLLAFSFAAPAGALLVYFTIGSGGRQTLSDFNGTAIAMLFSAGTFLYVATVHVLPELTHTHSHTHTHTLLPMQDGGAAKMGFSGLQCSEIAILAVGALLPALLTMGHNH
ncbi:zinc transporter ZIP9 [Plodia interpunctella]|uniref:zinc transporter ZIP9 n=1 Tax=Plodia interpunctella TaxID=58824 RepID=UPI002368EEFD|nr:zinc transporter ZIP9 [Plodia interpunctella]